jgi:phosphohistidine phosphatase
MRRLILFRHAKAAAGAPGQGDVDRPLDARGRDDAMAMGVILADAGVIPNLVLLSPSVRTRETWDLAAPALGCVPVKIATAIYDAAPEDILAELRAVDGEAYTVMVVGHNPGLQELSVELLITGRAPPREVERIEAGFPTAAAAVFRLGEDGRATLEGVLHPRNASRFKPDEPA